MWENGKEVQSKMLLFQKNCIDAWKIYKLEI
jgi:hypothetical protein